jgi:hypothetical protein
MPKSERLYAKYVREINNLLPNGEEPFARASQWLDPPQIEGWPAAAIEVRLDSSHRILAYLLNDRWATFYVDTHKPKSITHQHDGTIEIYGAEASRLAPKESPVSLVLSKVLVYYEEILRDHGLAGIPWDGTHDLDIQHAQLQVERIGVRRSTPHR